METPDSGTPVSGQGDAAGAAPVTDMAGGQGGEGGEGVSYAGFSTPEELAADYQSKVSEMQSLQTQLRNFESLKGRQGNEIGQLRQQIAQLTGQIEGMRQVQPQQQGPTLDQIAAKLDNGDINEAEAIRMASQITEQAVTTRLGQQFQQMLQTEIGKLQQQTAHEKYVSQFLSDNPGYKEAYESGKLDAWINQGLTGEQAWDKFRLESTMSELAALKKQAEDAAKAANQNGIKTGIQIEKGKAAAGKVLAGKGGQFAQTGANFDLNDPNQRRQAGIERLRQLRGGSI